MVYRNNAGRLGSGFISVCLETRWLGQKSGFYFPNQYCICLVCVTWHTTSNHSSFQLVWKLCSTIFNIHPRSGNIFVQARKTKKFTCGLYTRRCINLLWQLKIQRAGLDNPMIFTVCGASWVSTVYLLTNKQYTHTWRTHTHTHTPFCSLGLFVVCSLSLYHILIFGFFTLWDRLLANIRSIYTYLVNTYFPFL